MASDVTFVLTSCGRMDLLDRTLTTFFEQNTYPIDILYLVEDSVDPASWEHLQKTWGDKLTLRLNREKKGQIRSIVETYAQVKTPFIFHCEDDWEFIRPGFIEEMLKIMATDPKIIQVWLESEDSANRLPIFSYTDRKEVDGIGYKRVVCEEGWDWGHFSFRPGIKRLSDYEEIGGYGRFLNELDIGVTYRDLGYYTVIFEEPAGIDIGEGQTVFDPTRKWPTRRKWNKPKGLKRLWGHIKQMKF